MSGITTFLKKLGQVLVNAAGIAAGIGPIIQPFLGSGRAAADVKTAVNDLTLIGQATATIETAFAAIPNATGEQKLAALVPLVKNIVTTSELVVGKKVANDALFQQAVQEYAQATVDLLNSIHPDEVKTTS